MTNARILAARVGSASTHLFINYMESWNHRIVCVERDVKGHLVLTPAMGRDKLHRPGCAVSSSFQNHLLHPSGLERCH